DEEVFKYQLTELLSHITKKNDTHIIMYNAMAEGADLWAAECLEKKGRLIILDFDQEDKARNFDKVNIKVDIERKDVEEFGTKFESIQHKILQECDHIIVAWDGIFNFKPG